MGVLSNVSVYLSQWVFKICVRSASQGAGDQLDHENYYWITCIKSFNNLFNSCKISIQYEQSSIVWVPKTKH